MELRLRRLLLAGLIATLGATLAYAATYDFEQITVDNTAGGKSLTAAKIVTGMVFPGAVSCRVRTAEISFLMADPAQTTVTATVGMLAEPGDQIIPPTPQEALNLRMIRTGSTSGQVDCYYRSNP